MSISSKVETGPIRCGSKWIFLIGGWVPLELSSAWRLDMLKCFSAKKKYLMLVIICKCKINFILLFNDDEQLSYNYIVSFHIYFCLKKYLQNVKFLFLILQIAGYYSYKTSKMNCMIYVWIVWHHKIDNTETRRTVLSSLHCHCVFCGILWKI